MAKFFIDKYANVYSITVMTTHRIYKAYHIMPAVLEGWAYWFYCDEAEDRIIYGDGEIRQPYLSTEVFSRLEAKEISTLELLIIFGIDKG